MNYKLYFDSATGALHTLYAGWGYKISAAAILTLLLHKHAVLFYAFSLLVFLDCLTKWIAIARDYLIEQGQHEPTLLQAFLGIPAARNAGEIKSEVMKHRFLGKISVYLLCVMAAATADLIMVELLKPTWAVSTIIGYLTATELLSIVENLNAAGVEVVKGLIDTIKKKRI